MIAYLKGKTIKKTPKGIILDTGNVGYFVHLAKNSAAEIKENTEAQFFIHSHIKEDSFDLYGFTQYKDLEFFKLLITIKGIGPKIALEILNAKSEEIKLAVINEDEDFICRIPGIGKKTAKRIILELKEKIELDNIEERPYRSIERSTNTEAIDALLSLGYQRSEITRIIKDIPKSISSAEEIITYFLKNV